MKTKNAKKSEAKNNTVLSADPDRAMQEMMETIDSLRVIYVRETEVLNETDTKAFLELQEQKLEAARKYQVGIEDLLSRKEQMKNVSPLLKNRLAAMQKEFAALTEKNMEALKRMQRSTERLGDTIMGAAKDAAKSQRSFSYGDNGVVHNNDKRSVSMGVSETA